MPFSSPQDPIWESLPRLSVGSRDASLPDKQRISARGIILDDEGRVLLLSSHQYYEYVLPGGGAEEGETLLEALEREVREECGVVIDPATAVPVCVAENLMPRPELGWNMHQVHYYFRCGAVGTCPQHLDRGEKASGAFPIWLPMEQALAENEAVLRENDLFWAKREDAVFRLLLAE